MAKCPKKDNLPLLFARPQCFEDEGHEGKCRFEMNTAEIDEWFLNLNENGEAK